MTNLKLLTEEEIKQIQSAVTTAATQVGSTLTLAALRFYSNINSNTGAVTEFFKNFSNKSKND